MTLVAAAAVILAATAGFGAVRLALPAPAGGTERIALVAVNHDRGSVDIGTPNGRALLDGYLAEVRRATATGARYVVLPEATFRTTAATLAAVTEPMSAAAREGNATVLLGVIELGVGSADGYNIAQVYSPDGSVATYRKRHLIVIEPYEPGDEPLLTSGDHAVVICKDLDFPQPGPREPSARRPGCSGRRRGTSRPDGWLHSRMAIVRGIENGVPVARSARGGALTVSDARGHLLAEATATGGDGFASTAADLTVATEATLYTRFGTWFGWLCVAGLGWLVILGLTPGRRRVRPAALVAEEVEQSLTVGQ